MDTFYAVYRNYKGYNSKKGKVLIVFHDMITDMEANKKLKTIVTELFLIGKKTRHCTCFHVIILFQSAYNYKLECNTLIYHEIT